MLALELEDLVQEGKDGSIQRELDAVTAKLAETIRLETMELKKAMTVLDEVQLAQVAAAFREDRLKLNQRLEELRLLTKEDGRRIPTDPKRLLEEDPQLLKDALSRTIHWIALTDKGVVAHTTLGRHLAGRYRSRPNKAKVRQGREVSPPDLETLDECTSWFSDPARFLEGRRYALGEASNRLSDAELFPFQVTAELPKRKSKKV